MRKCLGFGVNNNFLCKLFRETKVIKTKTQEVRTFYNWIIIHQTSSVFVNTYLRSTEEGGLDWVGEGAVAGRGGCSLKTNISITTDICSFGWGGAV